MPDDDATQEDRTLRALNDTAARSRPRRDGDADDPDIPVAATVVLLRDADGGPEVLLIERPDRGSFAGAWVFPGGKLDPVDRDGAADEQAAARRAGVRETFEETGLVVRGSDLVTVSVWDPPPGIPLRIRTWFFVCEAPSSELVLSADEAVSARWERPGDVVERHGRGELTLYPPTWVTLHRLATHASVAAALDGARRAGLERFDTTVRAGASGPTLLWQDDGQYHDARAAASPRHRLDAGALPWVYSRWGFGDER